MLQQTTSKRITVIFTKNEYDAIRREAGDVPLMRWVRRAALSALVQLPGDKPRERKARVIKPVAPVIPQFTDFKAVFEKVQDEQAREPIISVADVTASLQTVCAHNYALKSCPFPFCPEYKWKDT